MDDSPTRQKMAREKEKEKNKLTKLTGLPLQGR